MPVELGTAGRDDRLVQRALIAGDADQGEQPVIEGSGCARLCRLDAPHGRCD